MQHPTLSAPCWYTRFQQMNLHINVISPLYITVHSWYCLVRGFGQMHDGVYPPHSVMQSTFTTLKKQMDAVGLFISPSSQALATMDFFSPIVLPFSECHIVGTTQSGASFTQHPPSLSIPVINTTTKATWRGRIYSSLQFIAKKQKPGGKH